MSLNQYYTLGQKVTLLNRACVEELLQHRPCNQKLLDAKNLLFEIRCDVEDNSQNYTQFYDKLCQAHELYINVVGKIII